MLIKKRAGGFNTYTVEMSWGQMESIHAALSRDHADPISDEMFQELSWFMSGNIPLPGEDESPKDMEKDAEKQAKDAEADTADRLLPEPPAVDKDQPSVDEPRDIQPADIKAHGDKYSGSEEADDLLPAPEDEE